MKPHNLKFFSSSFVFSLVGVLSQLSVAEAIPELAKVPVTTEETEVIDAVSVGITLSREEQEQSSTDATVPEILAPPDSTVLDSPLEELEREARIEEVDSESLSVESPQSNVVEELEELEEFSQPMVLEELETEATLELSTNLAHPTPLESTTVPSVPARDDTFDREEKLETQSHDFLPSDSTPSQPSGAARITFEGLYEADRDQGNPMAQFNPVSQFRDVNPTDWAYEALMNLSNQYGCLVGYPDTSFRGNRPLSRYEFAAGLNACMGQMERLIAQRTTNLVPIQDLEALQRLVMEFEAELATLATQVDALEGRVAFLEDHQFSTTTKLFGQAVIGIQGRSADNDFTLFQNRFRDEETGVNLIENVQLSLFSQFGPYSLLFTSFQMGDGNTGRTFTNTIGNYAGLGYEGDTDNRMILSDLNYRHLIGNQIALIVGPEGVNPVNVFRGVNRIESAGGGPLSRFAQRNPIINLGGGQGGLGVDWQISDRLSFQAVYSAGSPEDSVNGGLWGGDNGSTVWGAQFVASPTDTLDFSLQYINAYTPLLGSLRLGVGDDLVIIPNSDNLRAPINTDAFGAALEWRVVPQVALGGWVGYTTSNYQVEFGNAQTLNWMAFLRFPDLLGEGNVGGIYVGQPPKITRSSMPNGRNIPSFLSLGDVTAPAGGQPSTTTHLEVFYRFRVSDNISITPGVIVVFTPLQNAENDTITIGALRTTLSF